MSATAVIVCLDCRIASPPIGDYGFMGWPSLDERPTPPEGDEWEWAEFLPFGCLRRTFRDIGITSDELEAFAAFLTQHDGHQFGVDSDGQLQHPVEGGQEIVEAIEEAGAIPTPISYRELSERAWDGFIVGHYNLHCACGETYVSPEATVLKPVEGIPWTATLLERFRSHILESDECNFWRVTDPLLDPGTEAEGSDLREIALFVETHLDHGVVASVVASGE